MYCSIIRGGSNLDTSEQGTVAKVEIADDFLADNTQLTLLRLANLNISSSVSKLTANFPTKLQQFWLQNDLLDELPTTVANFKNLVNLFVAHSSHL